MLYSEGTNTLGKASSVNFMLTEGLTGSANLGQKLSAFSIAQLKDLENEIENMNKATSAAL